MFLSEPERTSYDLHFSIAGFPVRIHPFFWLIAVFMGSRLGLRIELFLWIAILFVSILIHELGHALAMRRFGESARIVLYAMGGLAIGNGSSSFGASGRSRHRYPIEQIIILFAGPAAGFILAVIVIALAKSFGADVVFHKPTLDNFEFWYVEGISNRKLLFTVEQLLFVNIFWGLINLLPVFPLDGGQIARQVLVTQDPYDGVRKSLLLSLIVGGALAVMGFTVLKDNYIAIMFGILAFSSYQALQQIGGGRGRRSPW